MSDFDLTNLTEELKIQNIINAINIPGLFTEYEITYINKAIKIHTLKSVQKMIKSNKIEYKSMNENIKVK